VLAAPAPAGAATLTNPVIPGDHPDPTIVRVGNVFYASATSASWATIFPLFRSTDLVT
jgi:xylan 1,4-beta-xylosidase